jgi:TolB-like protein/class 3 adenylate cyclase
LTFIPVGLSMAKDRLPGKLAVILHADIASSTALMRQDEQLAHERIQDCFHRFSDTVTKYHGHVCELRGDALLAEFDRASDAVTAALAFQSEQQDYLADIEDDIKPTLRIGIAMGEVVIADGTVTGAGIVLAQRVEQLATPGGLCITAAIHEALPARMPFSQNDLGDQALKGFDEPVHVYRVELSPGESIPPPQRTRRQQVWSSPTGLKWGVLAFALIVVAGIAYLSKPPGIQVEGQSIDHAALQLPEKPSIAVMPFINMSADPSQEYFADGITEDLITDLSKIAGLFVIARNSTFAYKGSSVDLRQVAEELGVRYVLEGSVRRSGDQVRINAQLIDATSGGHVWADRYDGQLSDVFGLQDKVTSKIVATLAVTLTKGELERVGQKETDNTQAYDAFLKGWEQYLRQSPQGFRQAIALFKQAIKLDPQYSRAYAALSATYWHAWKNYLVDKTEYVTPPHQTRYDAENYLAKALEKPTPLALQISSAMHAQFGRHEQAIEEGERAIALDPNAPDGYVALAGAVNLAGQPEKALTLMERAMRLNPHYPPSYLQELALARFGLEDFEKAAIALQRSVTLNPDDRSSSRLLIATLGHLGRAQEAKTIIDRMDSSVAFDLLSVRSVAYWYPFKNSADAERLAQGLRKAGVPD